MILLDTHIWVWWVMDVARLSDRHRLLLEQHERQVIGIADISCFEVAMLIARGRIDVPISARDWIRQALEYPGVRLFPIGADIAVAAAELPQHHKDPFDRLILATAKVHDATLLTVDGSMQLYAGEVRIV